MTDARLLDLQHLDTEIDRLRHRKDELESGGAVAESRARADAIEREVGESRLALDELATNQKRLEYDDDAMGQKIEAEQKRMYDGSIVNTRELGALEAEIKNLKERTARMEDELLELMVRREELEAEIAEGEARLTIARSQLETVGGDSAAELAEIDRTLTVKVEERTPLAASIDEELLELYEELRGHKHGVGAAALVDGVCQGCHEALSPLDLSKLKKTEGVKRCPTCRRILVD